MDWEAAVKTETTTAHQAPAAILLLTGTQTITDRLSITVLETQSENTGFSIIIIVPVPSAVIILAGPMTNWSKTVTATMVGIM